MHQKQFYTCFPYITATTAAFSSKQRIKVRHDNHNQRHEHKLSFLSAPKRNINLNHISTGTTIHLSSSKSSSSTSSCSSPPKISREQIKAAELELERMGQVTKRILSSYTHNRNPNHYKNYDESIHDQLSSDSFCNEFRVVLNYWSSRGRFLFQHSSISAISSSSSSSSSSNDSIHVPSILPSKNSISLMNDLVKMVTTTDTIPTNNTDGSKNNHNSNHSNYDDSCNYYHGAILSEALLNYLLELHELHPEYNLIDRVISPDGNMSLVNLMETYLVPCGGVGSGGGGSGNSNSGHSKINNNSIESSSSTSLSYTAKLSSQTQSWKQAVQNASRILDTMNQLIDQSDNALHHDLLSCNATLNVWSKLCLWLAATSNTTNTATTTTTTKEVDYNEKKDWNNNNNDNSNHGMNHNWGKKNEHGNLPKSCQNMTTVSQVLSQMEQLLFRMEEEYFMNLSNNTNNPNNSNNNNDNNNIQPCIPDEYTYNTIISTLARCAQFSNDPLNMAQRAEEYLKRMEWTEDQDRNWNLNLKAKNHEKSSQKTATTTTATTTNTRRTVCYPDTVTYNCVLHSYSSIMPKTKRITNTTSNTQSYNHHIPNHNFTSTTSTNTRKKKQHTTNTPENIKNAALTQHTSMRAASILTRMEERYQSTSRQNVQPDTISYSNVLRAYANAGKAREAERVLDTILSKSNQEGWRGRVVPNRICFNTAIDAWAKKQSQSSSSSNDDDPAERALAILQRMEDLSDNINYDTNYEECPPDTISYSSVISAFARSGRMDGAERAQELLERSLRLYQEGQNDHLRPDTITFNTVLGAWAKHAKLERHNSRNHKNKKYYSHNHLHANTIRTSNTEERALELLDRMHRLENAGNGEGGENIIAANNIRPCTISYNIILDMYANISMPEKAYALLQKMDKLYHEDGNKNVKPDIISYNTVLSALSNAPSKSDINAIEKAEKLLKKMEGTYIKEPNDNDDCHKLSFHIKPNVISYNAVIGALARRKIPGSAEKAEELLLSMEDNFESGLSEVSPNTVTYNMCINAWSKHGGSRGAKGAERILHKLIEQSKKNNMGYLRPDSVSFTSVINAISKSGERNSTDRAEALLKAMEETHGIMPNTITFNTVMNCHAQSGKKSSAKRAEELLLRMEDLSRAGVPDVRPDSVSFSTVINALSRCGESGSGLKAEQILKRMEDLRDDVTSHISPDSFTYASVLNTMSKSGEHDAPKRTLHILNRMEELHKSGIKNVAPNEYCYNAVLYAFAKSKEETKARSAYLILLDMKKKYDSGQSNAKPSMLTYSNVLNACAFTSSNDANVRNDAFSIARGCFKELLSDEYGKPNNIVFATFLLACYNLVPKCNDRDSLVSFVFKECCDRGMVDVKVIHTVQRLFSQEKARELFEGSDLLVGRRITFDDIPKQWTRSAKSRRSATHN